MPSHRPLPFGTRVVSSAFLAQALAVGLPISAYPVFISSLETELGATRTQASLGISLILVTGALLGPLVGRALDAGWAQVVMAGGALLFAAGFSSIAWTPNLELATLLWIATIGPGFAMLGPHPATTVLAKWFVARRGRMIAIAAMGTTFGGALTPGLAQALIGALGWRSALLGFGLIALTIGLPVALFGIRASPESVGAHPDGTSLPPPVEASPDPAQTAQHGMGTLLRDHRFWQLAFGFGLMTGISVGYVTHVVEWAGESGLERDVAVGVLVVNALFTTSGKLVFGWLTDRFGARTASLVGVACQLIGWAGMLFSSSSWIFMFGAALFSLGLGCMIPCQAAFVASIWGRAQFGRAAGLLGLVAIFGPFLVPVSLGIAFDRLGSYEWAMQVMWLAIALPAISLGLIGPARTH
jgi:MFS family permease